MQHRVVEDDVRGHPILARPLEAPRAQAFADRGPLAGAPRASIAWRALRACPAELREEPRGPTRPREPQRLLRARHADVEDPTFLVELGGSACVARRQLLLVETRKEDRVELEALRPVQRQQVDTARAVSPRIEAPAKLFHELAGAPVEAVSERHEPGEVGLTDELTFAELLGDLLEPAGVERRRAHRLRSD